MAEPASRSSVLVSYTPHDSATTAREVRENQVSGAIKGCRGRAVLNETGHSRDGRAPVNYVRRPPDGYWAAATGPGCQSGLIGSSPACAPGCFNSGKSFTMLTP